MSKAANSLVGLPLIVLLLTGCGSSLRSPTALQRYQALAPALTLATVASRGLSDVAAHLAVAVRAADGRGAVKDAGRCKREALGLQEVSGNDAAMLRLILRRRMQPVVRRYLGMEVKILEYEWAEGSSAARLAKLLSSDPFVLVPADSVALGRIGRAARWEAWQAVREARAAARWKARFGRRFRFVPVRTGRGGENAIAGGNGS